METDVLVVGGGLVGLAAGRCWRCTTPGSIVTERRPATSRHPNAQLVNVRSMETYRALGVADRIIEAREPSAGFAVADTLAGPQDTWIAPPPEETTVAAG